MRADELTADSASLGITMTRLDAPKVLLAHNRYQDRAGEDLSFDADRRLLVENGVEVAEYIRDNREIERVGVLGKLRIAAETSWAAAAKAELRELIQERRPDIAHFHNTFPLISPASYRACREAGIPVVQTLRNFRIFCAPGVFFRDGHICEDCVGKRVVWPGVVHACYRSSRPKSAAVGLMQTIHHSMHTWSSLVDAYIVPSRFMLTKLSECGLPADRIHVRPDVVEVEPGDDLQREEWGLFVGRLTIEKGIGTLLEAARAVEGLTMKVVGTGPLEDALRDSVSREGLAARVGFLGSLSYEPTMALLRRARFLIVPSESYETFGRVAVEALACGTPLIASRLGALKEIIEPGSTGVQFRPGDPDDLAAVIRWAMANPRQMAEMGRRGRKSYERRYAPGAALGSLIDIYDRARTCPLQQ